MNSLNQLLKLLGAGQAPSGAPQDDPVKAEAMRLADEQLQAAGMTDLRDPAAARARVQYFNQFYRDLLQQQMQQAAPVVRR